MVFSDAQVLNMDDLQVVLAPPLPTAAGRGTGGPVLPEERPSVCEKISPLARAVDASVAHKSTPGRRILPVTMLAACFSRRLAMSSTQPQPPQKQGTSADHAVRADKKVTVNGPAPASTARALAEVRSAAHEPSASQRQRAARTLAHLEMIGDD